MAKIKQNKKRNVYGIGGTIMSGMQNLGGSGLNSLVSSANSLMNPNGNSTTAGNVMSAVGSMASNIPGIGGLVGVGLNAVGGLGNAAFGSNINEEFVKQTEQNAENQAAITSEAKDNSSLLSDWGSYTNMDYVTKSQVGTDGWFSDKAKNKTKELNEKIKEANQHAIKNFSMAADTVDNTNDALAKSNYVAFGGPLYSDGGSIHIKPSKRGTFTAAAKKHGKSVQEFASQVLSHKDNYSPAMVKKANFARNAAKWHDDGGDLFNGRGPLINFDEEEPVISPLGRAASVAYLYDLENPRRRGISTLLNAGFLYDDNTLGAGIDTRYYGKGLVPRVKEGIPLDELDELAYKAISDYDSQIMNEAKKYASKPDTISQSPRLYAAQAAYHHGPYKKSERKEAAKALAKGDEKKLREIVEKKAEGWGRRKDAIKTPYSVRPTFEEWKAALPSNLRNIDPSLYDLRGAYETGLEPQWNDKDKSYHLSRRDPKTGRIMQRLSDPAYVQNMYEDMANGYEPFFKDGAMYTVEPFLESSLKAMTKNKKAGGGPLFTHGGTFSNGMTHVNEGGTHESNVLGGVPMGADNEGIPNLVEEGETVFDGYVFSDRLKVPKETRKMLKARGKTFSDVAKNISKESEERPNDPISKNGLLHSMETLKNAQEEMRMRKRKKANRFDIGGDTDGVFTYMPDANYYLDRTLPEVAVTAPFASKTPTIPSVPYNVSGSVTPINVSPMVPEPIITPSYEGYSGLSYLDAASPSATSYNVNGNITPVNPTGQEYVETPRYYDSLEIPSDTGAGDIAGLTSTSYGDVSNAIDNLDTNGYAIDRKDGRTFNKATSSPEAGDLSYLRYVPALASGVASIVDIFSKPDYSAAEQIENVDITPSLVSSTPIGQKLTYRPMDRNYYINKLNSNAGATRRSLMNASGGNRGSLMAGLLAANRQYGESLGTLARQAEEYNDNMREKVATFNRATDQFNSQQSLQAQTTNAQNRNVATQARLAQAEAAAKYRQAARDAYDARRSNNLNNFINSIADIGREEFQRNMLNSNNALYYDLARNGLVGYKGEESKKNGGKLNKKKRRFHA